MEMKWKLEMETGNGNWKWKLETELETEMETQPLKCCSHSKIHVLLDLSSPHLYIAFDCLLC